MSTAPAEYVGRFAPSPTGPLHFGSLLAAVASYLQARTQNGQWLLRVEDIDPPREPPGSDRLILAALEQYGFEWDGPVTYQSANTSRHEELLQDLIKAGHAYPCSCSRRDLANFSQGALGTIYPGTCRAACRETDVSYRLRTTDVVVEYHDALQGLQQQRLESESGDFVIKRRDGLIAYHLAVVVDDFDQGITEIVRGIDLLETTPRHIFLQRCLDFSTPSYVHIPVVKNAAGQKLSKLTGAAAISSKRTNQTLVAALQALRQRPPESLAESALDDIWNWAMKNWNISTLQGQESIPLDQFPLADTENEIS